MSKFITKFETTAAYEAAQSSLILPNVSLITENNKVEYNPYVPPTPVETRVVAKYNVTSTSDPTILFFNMDGFSEIEIDGVVQPSVVGEYTFDTVGEHTVKCTLTDQTSIGEQAFSNCRSLTSITIPNSVTSIGYQTFRECSGLTSCIIGSGITSIGEQAFMYCTNLTRLNSDVNGVLNLPNSVTTIETEAFSGCDFTSVNIPSGVTSIGWTAFCGCELDSTSIAAIQAINPDALDCE